MPVDMSILGVIAILLAIWVIWDVLVNNKRRFSTELKIIWVVLAVLFSIITAKIYYFVYKAKK